MQRMCTCSLLYALHLISHILTGLMHCGPAASFRHFLQCWACSVGLHNAKLHFIALPQQRAQPVSEHCDTRNSSFSLQRLISTNFLNHLIVQLGQYLCYCFLLVPKGNPYLWEKRHLISIYLREIFICLTQKMKNLLAQIFPQTFFSKKSSMYLFPNFILVTVVYKKKMACLFKLCHCIRNESFYCITLHIW